jgi:predicted ATP-dependent protease
MGQAVTRDDIDEVLELLHTFMKQVDDRFNEQEKKYDRLITTIDGFISRIDKYEVELAARDAQFQRLLDWARKVSSKTGIPLENL